MDNKKAVTILQAVRANTADAFIAKVAIREALDMAIAALEQQEKAFDEWCTDCKEYDHNRNCCPRYNRVIRGAVDEVKQQGWIPVTERLPKKQTKVLVVDFGEVDTAYINSEGRWMDFYGDKLKDVTAWRLLPKPPYQEDKA